MIQRKDMKQMKIGVFNNLFALSVGGGETYTANMCQALRDEGCNDITIVAARSFFRSPRPLLKDFPIKYVPSLYELREWSRTAPYPLSSLLYRVQDEWYRYMLRYYMKPWDIIHCQATDSARTAIKKRRPEQAIILNLVGMVSPNDTPVLSQCDFVVSAGYSIVDYVREKLGVDCVLIPQGVDLDFFKKGNQKEARTSTGLRGNPQILFVGRLIDAKNVEVLIKAMPYVLRQLPDAHLAIVGTGVMLPSLKSLVQELDLSASVSFEGARTKDELVKYYNSADVFVLPSKSDFIPLVTLEAIACGCKVVVSSRVVDTIQAFPEVSVARFDEPQEFATQINYVVGVGQEPFSPERMQEFSWSSVARRYIQTYEEALQRRREHR